ncbi:SIR2 family protein [Sorangium sp. So ce291]|uniref:SIR2 family NAD-dependent protein deacylase n=1 Tax=Sorangium sp. So ce291 TaxID=3133294 RepID=UPI003F6216E9
MEISSVRSIDLYIHSLDGEQKAQTTRAMELFHRPQDTIRLVPRGERSLPTCADRVDWDMVLQGPPAAPAIIVTGCRLLDNWFTHTQQGVAVVSVADWKVAFLNDSKMPHAAPDANLLLSLSLVVFMVLLEARDYDVLHERTTGCVCDLCVNKPDRAVKIRAGFVCDDCRQLASESGLSAVEVDAIQAVLECVRALALGRAPQAHVPHPAKDDEQDLIDSAALPKGQALPRRLVEACRERRLTVLVGSGLSMQSDVRVKYGSKFAWNALPSWSEVPRRLSDTLARYRDKVVAPRPAETVAELLADLDYFRISLGEKLYYPRAIFDIFTPAIESPGMANRLVFRLPLRWLLTTNYDFVLNCAAPAGTAVYTWRESRQAREYIEASERRAPLLKIHGCASRPDTVVLTQSEYQALRNHDEYVSLINAVFDSQVVLFLGFGMSDPLDLDLAIQQAELAGAAQGEKFALVPLSTAGAIREKFRGVTVVPYQHHEDVPLILAWLIREVGQDCGA